MAGNGSGLESASEADCLFELRNVRHTFAGKGGVEIDELRIRRGKITAIIGRSGSGKSTLLHLLGAMLPCEPPHRDSTLRANLKSAGTHDSSQDVRKRRWRGAEGSVGFVFQQPFLLRDANAGLNIEMALSTAGRQTLDAASLQALWAGLGLVDTKLWTPARDLSGGMQQRLAVGRAIARNPSVLLADEPTANLDPVYGRQIMDMLVAYTKVKDSDRSLVIVSHDLDLVCTYADEIIVLESPTGSQTGRVSLGAPLPVANPRNLDTLRQWLGAGAPDSRPEPIDVPPAIRRGFFADLALWIRLGIALVLNGGKPNPKEMLGWGLLVHLVLAVAVVAAPLYLLEETTCALVVPPISLLIALSLLPRLWPRFGVTGWIRSFAMAVLVVTGLVALLATNLVTSASERGLRSPDLRMLVSGSGKTITSTFIRSLAEGFETALAGIPGAEPPRLFGRQSLPAIFVRLPSEATQGARPDCSAANLVGDRVSAGAEGIYSTGDRQTSDPLPEYLAWRPVGDADKIGLAPEAPGRTTPPDLTGTVKEARPTGGTVYVVHDFLVRQLHLKPDQHMIRWLCLDIMGQDNYAPFQVVAVVREIPDFDSQSYSLLIDGSVAATYYGARATRGNQVQFSTVAVDIVPAQRDAILAHLRTLGGGQLTLESGFKKLSTAVGVASASVWLAHSFSIIVLLLGAIVTIVMTLQFIDTNRRELAVASAFGAPWSRLALLTATILLLPFIAALLAAAAMIVLVLPETYAFVTTALALPRDMGVADPWIALAKVGGAGFGLIAVVAGGALLAGRWWGEPLAKQLQAVA